MSQALFQVKDTLIIWGVGGYHIRHYFHPSIHPFVEPCLPCPASSIILLAPWELRADPDADCGHHPRPHFARAQAECRSSSSRVALVGVLGIDLLAGNLFVRFAHAVRLITTNMR